MAFNYFFNLVFFSKIDLNLIKNQKLRTLPLKLTRLNINLNSLLELHEKLIV